MINGLYNLNPAAAGIEGGFISQLTASKKWTGIAGSPANHSFSNSVKLGAEGFYDENMFVQRPLFNIADRVGIGLTIFSETSGPLCNTGLLFAYAYHLPLAHGKLSFGLSGIISEFKLSSDEFKPLDESDPDLYSNSNEFRPNANLGILYKDDRLFLGLSYLGLLSYAEILNTNYNTSTLSLWFGYKLRINELFMIEPSAFIFKSASKKYRADLNVKLSYRNFPWILISLKNYKALDLGVGLHIKKHFQLIYLYSLNVNGTSYYFQNNHSVSLRLNIGSILRN